MAIKARKRLFAAIALAVSSYVGTTSAVGLIPIDSVAPLEHVQTQLDKLALIDVNPDLSQLPASEKAALDEIVKATKYIDRIFRTQVHKDNNRMRFFLSFLEGTTYQAYYDYFKVMQGPWDRVEMDKPFINLDDEKIAGVNYYPADMTNEEFEEWIAAHPEDEEDFRSGFTMIRRSGDDLIAIPYSKFFRSELRMAAYHLKKAARLTEDKSLEKYLLSRAAAFKSNDYRESDIDWIGLNGDIELVVGPYETYEDERFGYKAAFESFVTVTDHEESAKLEAIEGIRTELIDNYPLPDGYDLTPKGLSSPIKVVNEVFTGGDARSGYATIAFNLPNDEWVRDNVGSKNVMLKNMLEAKFEGVLTPIKDTLLSQEDQGKPSFSGFFNFVLMHEISHGLGPGNIVVDGRETTVRAELKELYSTIEECQADVLSIHSNQYIIDMPDSPIPSLTKDELFGSYLAGMFRSIRFGTNSAHGGGVAIQLNWHLENGGFEINEAGLFKVNDEKLKDSVASLAQELLLIELNGDYARATALMENYRFVSPQIQAALDKLADVPVDIRKHYAYD